jgi:hypothetical protein
MKLRLELDELLGSALLEQAIAERRPISMQAEVALRRALGLPVPVPTKTKAPAVAPARAH